MRLPCLVGVVMLLKAINSVRTPFNYVHVLPSTMFLSLPPLTTYTPYLARCFRKFDFPDYHIAAGKHLHQCIMRQLVLGALSILPTMRNPYADVRVNHNGLITDS